MKVTIDWDPPEDIDRKVTFSKGGLHENEHTQSVWDALDALTNAVLACQDTEHKPGFTSGPWPEDVSVEPAPA